MDVKPECGCTTPLYKKIIAPGERGGITLKLDTRNLKDTIDKIAKVRTNDAKNAEVFLNLKAFVKVPIYISKKYVVFNPGKVGIFSGVLRLKTNYVKKKEILIKIRGRFKKNKMG